MTAVKILVNLTHLSKQSEGQKDPKDHFHNLRWWDNQSIPPPFFVYRDPRVPLKNLRGEDELSLANCVQVDEVTSLFDSGQATL